MKRALPEPIHEALSRLCAGGDALAKDHDYAQSIVEYQQAWELLPEPKMEWEAAAWILAAIGDACFLDRQYARAAEVFTQAILNTRAGPRNPFLHLRLGQSLFETGRQREAANELMLAYMGGGEPIFTHEDPKYFQYLGSVAIL